MTNRSPRLGAPVLASALLASLTLVSLSTGPAAGGSVSLPGAQSVAAAACTTPTSARHGHLLGVVAPRLRRARAAAACAGVLRNAASPTSVGHTGSAGLASGFSGSPPLQDHGGPVMGTATTPGDVTVVPVFWDPGNTMTAGYKSEISGYLANVAADDGLATNVFSTYLQYGVGYHIHAGSAVVATQSFTNGCTPDSGPVYKDNTGYATCVTDAQVQGELSTVLSAHGLPADLAHVYMVLLPKGVESCATGSDNAQGGQCTVSSVGGTFCGYHANTTSNAVYADIPFPVYSSPTGFTCGSESALGVNQFPNNQPDADVVLDVFSHELNESITDPLGTAWYDRTGNEIGDDCAGIYGSALGGAAGAEYNQTINGAHYFTQEEFSNEDYHVAKGSACIQRVDLPVAAFKVTPRILRTGRPGRFNAKASKGTIVAYSWTFDGGAATSGRTVSHAFTATGTHFVSLTVTDATGIQKQSTAFVAVH